MFINKRLIKLYEIPFTKWSSTYILKALDQRSKLYQ